MTGVLTEVVITGRSKGAGVPVELRFWLILWFVAGKVKRRQVFWMRQEALEAAGLSESAMSQTRRLPCCMFEATAVKAVLQLTKRCGSWSTGETVRWSW